MIVEEIDTLDRIMNIHTTIIQFHPFKIELFIHSYQFIWYNEHWYIIESIYISLQWLSISIYLHSMKSIGCIFTFTIIHFNHKYHWLHPFISYHTYINTYRFQYDHHPFISNTLFILHIKINHLNRLEESK